MKIIPITSKAGDRVRVTEEALSSDLVLQRLIGSIPMNATVIDATEDGHSYPIVVEFDDGTLYAFEQYQVERAE